jgi:5-methyltetrahydrofolate--homocysteine methyltransferase
MPSVTTSLLSTEGRAAFEADLAKDYEQLRRLHSGAKKDLIALDTARSDRTPIVWRKEDIARPSKTGIFDLPDIPLATLREYIDWTPFFHTWELKGVYPRILTHEKYGEQAKKVFDEANLLLDRIVSEKLITAKGVYGIFPAHAEGDDVVLDNGGPTFHFLRQQSAHKSGEPHRSLADYIAPAGQGDHIGAFAVTAGLGVDELCASFRKQHDDYNAIMAEALADRLAEAGAEYMHELARKAWGLSEDLSKEDLIAEKYRGIRPAAGYPACPDHTEKATLWQLLDVEKRTGMKLTESYAMWPGASVSGLYFVHPESRYFTLGKIDRDQAADYAERKGMKLQDVERWLGSNLGYEPAS